MLLLWYIEDDRILKKRRRSKHGFTCHRILFLFQFICWIIIQPLLTPTEEKPCKFLYWYMLIQLYWLTDCMILKGKSMWYWRVCQSTYVRACVCVCVYGCVCFSCIYVCMKIGAVYNPILFDSYWVTSMLPALYICECMAAVVCFDGGCWLY